MMARDILPLWHAADDAWHRSLVAAFGKRACDRRYDGDQSDHPAECRALYEEFARLRDAHKVAWLAEDAAEMEQFRAARLADHRGGAV